MTDCCSHRSMHPLSRIWEASTYCTSLLAQRPTTDQGTEDKRRQKRSALNRTHILYPPLLKDHCRRGNRTNIRARGRGWLHSVFWTQRDRQLHKWTHSSLDKPNPSMMMEVRYKIPPPAMELWVTVSFWEKKRQFSRNIAPGKSTVLQGNTIHPRIAQEYLGSTNWSSWALKIKLKRTRG